MTNEIKEYKKFTQIETFDWIVNTTATPEEIDRMISNSKFLIVWEKRIAVHQIKNYWPKKVEWIEAYIMDKTKDEQIILNARLKEKMERIGRWRDSIEEIDNYLHNKK